MSKWCILVITVLYFPWPFYFSLLTFIFFLLQESFLQECRSKSILSAMPVPFTMTRRGMLCPRRGPDALGWKWNRDWSVVFICCWNLGGYISCAFLSSSTTDTRAYFWPFAMMTSSNRNVFRVTGPLCGEFTGRRWFPLRKASDAELWFFLRSAPEQTIE